MDALISKHHSSGLLTTASCPAEQWRCCVRSGLRQRGCGVPQWPLKEATVQTFAAGESPRQRLSALGFRKSQLIHQQVCHHPGNAGCSYPGWLCTAAKGSTYPGMAFPVVKQYPASATTTHPCLRECTHVLKPHESRTSLTS